jgi:O-antigen ligase
LRTDTAPPTPIVERSVAVLVGLIIVIAPLFRAGATPLAALALQWLGIALIVLALWTPRAASLSRLEILLIFGLVLTPLLYLLPLPADWIGGLASREMYQSGIALLAPHATTAGRALSIHPDLTATAGLALIVPIAVFIGTRMLRADTLLLLAKILLAVAVTQAIIGVIQFASQNSGEAVLTLAGGTVWSGTGTYANRNHLAGLLAMTLPIALALLMYQIGRDDKGSTTSWRSRARFLGSHRGTTALVLTATVLLILLGLIFTRSRMGITMAMLGLVLTTLLFARRLGGDRGFRFVGGLVAVAIGIGAAIGLAPVLSRFTVAGVVEDGRVDIFSATILRIGQLLPFGSGPGTYSSALPPVQPMRFGNLFPNHAHNDYLEWVSDAGFIAAVLILIAIGLYLFQWTRVYTSTPWSRARFVQVASGISLLLIALHELVDYNLAIPANQAIVAFLAGIFFMPPARLDAAASRSRKVRRTPKLEPVPSAPVATQPEPAEQILNPFLDVAAPPEGALPQTRA